MLKFIQRLVSSETLQLSLFSPPPRYSVISNQIITLLPTIVMTSRIVVYMGAWFTGAWSARGRGCTAAAGSVCSVHINEMFHTWNPVRVKLQVCSSFTHLLTLVWHVWLTLIRWPDQVTWSGGLLQHHRCRGAWPVEHSRKRGFRRETWESADECPHWRGGLSAETVNRHHLSSVIISTPGEFDPFGGFLAAVHCGSRQNRTMLTGVCGSEYVSIFMLAVSCTPLFSVQSHGAAARLETQTKPAFCKTLWRGSNRTTSSGADGKSMLQVELNLQLLVSDCVTGLSRSVLLVGIWVRTRAGSQ